MTFPKKPNNPRHVYLDNAAITPIDQTVIDAMHPYMTDVFYNPSSLYSGAQKAAKAIITARKKIADILGTQPDTITFTSGGTESCNLALLGSVIAQGHIITTRGEHKAVLAPIQMLEKQNWDVTYLDLDEHGQMSVEEFKKALRPNTTFVSIMAINNEIGTINPIADIGREILKHRKKHNISTPYFHTDACQASQFLDLSVEKSHVDFLTLNGTKMYGPRATGILYHRRGMNITPQIIGGGQEAHKRAGTENIPGIIGLATSLKTASEQRTAISEQIQEVRDYFWEKIQSHIPDVTLNGPILDSEHRSPNNLNLSFLGVEAEALVIYLDQYGIQCGTGSACTSESTEPSHVLAATGKSKDQINSAIRFTLSKHTIKDDIDYVMNYLPDIIKALREQKQ